jgi:glyoxylase I family protein
MPIARSAAQGERMALFTGLDHPAISCFDVKKQIDWYCSVLGMRLIASNGEDPPSVVVGYSADTRGGTMIELMPVKDTGPRPADVPRFCPGIRHLALRVNDFDRAYADLERAGVQFLFEPAQAVGGGKIVSFRDPEGNELQIVER